MKRNLIIFGSLTILSSSFLIVSCTRQNSNIKIKNEKVNTDTNKTINNKKDKNDKQKDKNNSNPNPKEPNIKDPNKNIDSNNVNMLNDDSNNNLTTNSEEEQNIVNLLKDWNRQQDIKNYSEEQIGKKQYLINEKNKNSQLVKYDKKIRDLFNKKQFEELKKEFINLLNEVIEIVSDKKPFEDKLQTYKNLDFSKHLIEGILEDLKLLVETKFSITQEIKDKTMTSKFLDEINKLISQKNTEELKNKLFKLVDEISQLEKTQK
uniref:Lipoprotein n=1 Tax=Mycoplasma feriruminatoris TaxID=1179777 RepID=A0A654II71_9MOLU|nr:hypothetical protein MF5295_00522 [Mycoplasma feriruminatoris]